MNDLYFDVSNVRGFAENLHYRLENEYLQEIAHIKAKLLLGDNSANDRARAAHTKPMGNVDAGYYGRDIAEVQDANVAAFLLWLDGVEDSVRAVVNAGLYISEELDSSDGTNAANIDGFFEAPTFEDMDYLDPSADYPGR